MSASIKYYCSCLSNTNIPPAPHLPSSSHSFHTLPELYFCEECDAVRCNECVSIEVSGYYCPNCLFEVPSASVRAEKNRCVNSLVFQFALLMVIVTDALETVSSAPSVSIPYLSFRRTLQTMTIFEHRPPKSAAQENHRSYCIVTIADGIPAKRV